MAVDQAEVGLVKSQLWQDETVELTARQRRVGPAGSLINPTSVIATSMRIIIVNKTTLGLHKDFESIPYRQITSVRYESGIISSSVFIRVEGFDTDKGFLKGTGKQEGEIDGLNNADAKQLSDYIEKRITGDASEAPAPGAAQAAAGGAFCASCGAMVPAGAKFCPKCGAKVA
jgi:hypothetical protein